MAPPPTGRRELIVDAALKVFSKRGYEGTTVSTIAEQLDTSKAAVAYYFPTKDLFLDEFITPFLDDLDTRVCKTLTDGHQAVDQYLATLTDHHAVAVWTDTDPIIQHHPKYGKRLTTINRRLLRCVHNGSNKTNDHARAIAVLGGIWRPARWLTTNQLRSHHNELVTAALASYEPQQPT